VERKPAAPAKPESAAQTEPPQAAPLSSSNPVQEEPATISSTSPSASDVRRKPVGKKCCVAS
jgi:hypothetical protein